MISTDHNCVLLTSLFWIIVYSYKILILVYSLNAIFAKFTSKNRNMAQNKMHNIK